jgi:homoserine dehydrogenase
MIVGFGVVGSTLGRMLTARQLELRRRCGFGIRTVAVTDSVGSAVDNHGLNLKEISARKRRTGTVGSRAEPDDRLDIIREVGADVVVELTPGNHSTGLPGSSHFEAALRSGKHLVTANKTTLALDYPRFMRVARDQGLKLMYGACVGGGVPILDFGESCSAAESITKIEGVLNTTSNFILTEIERNGRTFREALLEAQRLGYTEADPSLDIDGFDSACKIVIIANHVLGTSFRLKDVSPIVGIRRITESQVKEAGAKGHRIRMIALAKRHLEVMVTKVPWNDELAVEGPSYAVRFHCKYSGARTVSGMGAGGKTTSIAVLRDIIALGKSLLN